MEESYIAGIQVRAKRSSHCEYTVANEYICQELGRAIGLPIPVGALIEKDGVVYYASLDFNVDGHQLPPADADAIVRDHPGLSVGVVMFDVWIGNCDRHNQNLSYNTKTKKLHLYDHGHCLLFPDGVASMTERRNQVDVSDHCLANRLQTMTGARYWFDRIRSLPRDYIADTVRSALTILPTFSIELERGCINELEVRRAKLLELINNHHSMFPSLLPCLINELDHPPEPDYII